MRNCGSRARSLATLERGQGKVLLIEGDPGVGKTGLLEQVLNEADRRHFSLAKAEADEIGQRTPFAPLLTALQDAVSEIPGETSLASAPESWAPAVNQLRALLERRAAASPLLVSLDDLHYGDPATLVRAPAPDPAARITPAGLESCPEHRAATRPRQRAVRPSRTRRRGAGDTWSARRRGHRGHDCRTSSAQAVPDPGLRELAGGRGGEPLLADRTRPPGSRRRNTRSKWKAGTAVLVAAQLPGAAAA